MQVAYWVKLNNKTTLQLWRILLVKPLNLL